MAWDSCRPPDSLVGQVDVAIKDVQEAAARTQGRVIVACLPSIAYRIMPYVIASNEAGNPGIRVIVRDVNVTAIVAAVTAGQADIGIGSFVVPGPSLDGVAIARDRFFAILPKHHPLARQADVRWRDLEGFPYIAMTAENGIRQLVDNTVGPQGIRLAIASEVSNLATLYGLLEAGVGVTALPGLALPADDHPFLVCRPLKDPTVERTIHVVWRHGIGLSPSARAMIDAIRRAVLEGRVPNDGKRVQWSDSWMAPQPGTASEVLSH